MLPQNYGTLLSTKLEKTATTHQEQTAFPQPPNVLQYQPTWVWESQHGSGHSSQLTYPYQYHSDRTYSAHHHYGTCCELASVSAKPFPTLQAAWTPTCSSGTAQSDQTQYCNSCTRHCMDKPCTWSKTNGITNVSPSGCFAPRCFAPGCFAAKNYR